MEDLRRRLERGEQSAFAELYDVCADRLHRYLTLRTGSRDDADDLVQESFVRLARSREKLTTIDNVIAYLFAIARNEAHRLLSGRINAARQCATPAAVETTDEDAQRETQEEIRAALEQLPEEQREIVVLKVYGELTFREIATVTGLPQGTVATRYRAALERLRSQMLRDLS